MSRGDLGTSRQEILGGIMNSFFGDHTFLRIICIYELKVQEEKE